jgi:hypothetical protein
MVNKKLFIITLILIGLILNSINIVIHPVKAEEEWIIDGDMVYVNNSKLYASVTPHTIESSGWVTFEFESKVYNGNIDMCWGFDEELVKPKGKVYIWRNYTHNLMRYKRADRTYEYTINNVSSYQNLGFENYDYYDEHLEEMIIGNKNNTKLFNVTFEGNGSVNATFAFQSWEQIGDGDDYRVTGNLSTTVQHEYQRTFFDWKEIDLDYTKKKWNYGGMNTWYIVRNQSIQQNKRYKIRVWIDIEFHGFFNNYGKYWYAFKPSSETFEEAKNNGHLYYLDPWYNTDWERRKPITINSNKVSGDLTNFPICINITDTDLRDDAQSDGADILFTLSDGDTKIAHEIEKFDSSTGHLVAWVNVTSVSSSSDTTIYMYYQNSGASNQSNPSGVWDSDYYTVVHCNQPSNALTDSTETNNWAKYSTPTYHDTDGQNKAWGVDYDGSGDGHEDNTPATLSGTDDVTFEWYCEQQSSDDRGTKNFDNTIVSFHGDSKTGCTAGTNHEPATFKLVFKEDDASADQCLVETSRTVGERYYFVATFDASENKAELFKNSVSSDTDTNALVGDPNYDNLQDIGNVKNNNKGWNGILDEFRVSTILRSTDYIKNSIPSFVIVFYISNIL